MKLFYVWWRYQTEGGVVTPKQWKNKPQSGVRSESRDREGQTNSLFKILKDAQKSFKII